jgi:hypothetical protein
MVNDLARPLVAECMEDRDRKDDPVHVIVKESPLETASMQLAADIIQDAKSHLKRDVLKQPLDKSEGIVLTLPRMGHIDEPKDSIMTT